MMRRIARIARSRIAAIAMGLLLAVIGMAALPAAPASASSNVSAVFSGDSDYATPSCSAPGTYYYPGSALQVYNPCSTRVWVHYTSGSSVQAYCVNPGGAIAYDLPIHWASGDTSDLQITSNGSPCYASNAFFTVAWLGSCSVCTPAWNPYPCHLAQPLANSGLWVYAVWNNESSTNQGPGTCPFRIWVHQYDNGTGMSACIDPGHTIPASLGFTSPVYWQVLETDNQAPCSAGGPPYPY